jgi:thymidylate kinase
MAGSLIAFEGLDQSGKQTQRRRRDYLTRRATLPADPFPDY